MHYERTIRRAPFDTDRRPGGKNYLRCRWCGSQLSGRKTSWCGKPQCLFEYTIRTSPGAARSAVFKRDRGVCRLCTRDCYALEQKIRQLEQRLSMQCNVKALIRLHKILRDHKVPVRIHRCLRMPEGRWTCRIDERLESFTLSYPSLWQADHIVPVAEGGGGCGLDNLRTLCLWCHRQETQRLMERLRLKCT